MQVLNCAILKDFYWILMNLFLPEYYCIFNFNRSELNTEPF